jgi:hypothetical protein
VNRDRVAATIGVLHVVMAARVRTTSNPSRCRAATTCFQVSAGYCVMPTRGRVELQ